MTEEKKSNGAAAVLAGLGLGFIKLDWIRAIIFKTGGRKMALGLILLYGILEILKVAGGGLTIAHGLLGLGLGIGVGLLGIGVAIEGAAKARAEAAAAAAKEKEDKPDEKS